MYQFCEWILSGKCECVLYSSQCFYACYTWHLNEKTEPKDEQTNNNKKTHWNEATFAFVQRRQWIIIFVGRFIAIANTSQNYKGSGYGLRFSTNAHFLLLLVVWVYRSWKRRCGQKTIIYTNMSKLFILVKHVGSIELWLRINNS